MIVELLDPLDADSVLRTAVALWEDKEREPLSTEQQRAVLRASQAIATADAGTVLTPFPAPVARVTLTPTAQVWLLRRWDRHADDVSLWTDEDSAREELGRHVRGSWRSYAGQGGMPEEPPDDDGAAVLRGERRHGAAQAYFFGAQNDGSASLVAEHGVIIRRGASDDEGAAGDPEWEIGEPLPFEQQERDRLIAKGGDVEFEWEFALLEMAPKLAGALSINPLEVGATTSARGQGMLALTPYGAVHGVPPGALPI